jgi:ubiquinone/menaquinone biosynthesis C-methylase UbiE
VTQLTIFRPGELRVPAVPGERQPAEPLASSKAQAAEAHFDRWAGAYGRSRLLPSLQKKALAELRPRAGDRLLDVACGAGALVAEVAPHVDRAVGVDLSDGMLELARSRLSDAGADRLANVEFFHGPSDALPFDDGSFTALVCTTALHHFPDPQRSIDEMARVLEPGGRVVIGDICRDGLAAKLADPLFRRFEKGHVGLQRTRDIKAMLTRAGLRVTNSRHALVLLYTLVSAERPASSAQEPRRPTPGKKRPTRLA